MNNQTNFSHYIEEAEIIQTEGIHNVQQGGVNREVGFIFLQAEINNIKVTEAVGISKS